MEKRVEELAKQIINNEEHFIVEIKVSSVSNSSKVTLIVDGDNGFNIDDCGHLSRQLGDLLESEEVFENSYTLEITSPGVGEPLKLVRQYTNNIGRSVRVLLKDQSEHKGELKKVEDSLIMVEVEKKVKEGKKKRTIRTMEKFSFDDIHKTNVLVSFK